jgi:hypothetical protein
MDGTETTATTPEPQAPAPKTTKTVAAQVPLALYEAARAAAKAKGETLGAAVIRGLELYSGRE